MARVLLFMIVLLMSHISYAQTDNYWTGNTSDDWNDAGNWALGTVPNSSHKAIIRLITGKPNPVLHSNATIGFLDMAGSASLYLGGFELTTETVWVSYSNIHSEGGAIRTKMIRLCTGMHFFGNLTIHTDNGVGSGNTYHGDLTVYANSHIPVGQTSASCWPCGSLMFSNVDGDTFMGKSIFIKKNVGSLLFGVFFGNTEFQKPVAIIDSSSTGLYVDFAARGGTIKFKDSLDIRIRGGWLKFKSTLEFQKPVTFNQTGGEIGLEAWLENGVTQRASLATFKSDIILNKSGGILSLGSWTGSSIKNSSIIESNGAIKKGTQGVLAGILNITHTTINSPSTILTASTNPGTGIYGSAINFEHSFINGGIHIRADNIDATATTFNGRTILNKDGYSPTPNSRGGNTFNKPVELINSAGFNWYTAFAYPDNFKDSLKVILSGNGQKSKFGTSAVFKVGMADSSTIGGPLTLVNGSNADGEFYLGSLGNGPLYVRSTVHMTDVTNSNVTFNASRFLNIGTLDPLELGGSSNFFILLSSIYDRENTIKASHLRITNSYFPKPSSIIKTANGDDNNYGGNTFHQQTQFKNTASSGNFKLLSGEDKLIK